jgi:hypothetical protein
MESRLDTFFSRGYGHGSNVTQHLTRKEARALHSMGLDSVFNQIIRKRFPFEPVLYKHNPAEKKWVTSNAMAWTIPIHITSIAPEYSFDALIHQVREDPKSFATPILEYACGAHKKYLTYINYSKENETSGIIYITFLSNQYEKGDLDEEGEEDEEDERKVDQHLLSEARKEFKKRIDWIENMNSYPNYMLYNYDWSINADEINIETDVSKLGARKRTQSKRRKGTQSKRRKGTQSKRRKGTQSKRSKKINYKNEYNVKRYIFLSK